MSFEPRFRHQVFLAALAVGLAAFPLLAAAQSGTGDTSLPGVTAPADKGARVDDNGQSDDGSAVPDDAAPQRNDSIVTRPMDAGAGTFKTEKIQPGAEPKANGDVKPSEGVGVFDRMGANLPDLPPEKPFKGKVDDAYGAFQRGYYLTAFNEATKRVDENKDPKAMTLLAELYANGFGVKQDDAKAVTSKSIKDSVAFGTVTDSGTVTLDFAANINWNWTIGGNRTLANPSGMVVGQRGVIRITQDGTGSRTLAFGSKWKKPGGTLTLSTASGAVDRLDFHVIDANTIDVTLSKAFS